MDAKGRLAIPSKVREELAASGQRIVITANISDRCLLVYTEAAWDALRPEIEALPNVTDRAARRAQRLLLGYANVLEIDGNGRVLLPQPLRDYASLEKKLMLVGQGKKFELWSENAWYDAIAAEEDETQSPAMEQLSL